MCITQRGVPSFGSLGSERSPFVPPPHPPSAAERLFESALPGEMSCDCVSPPQERLRLPGAWSWSAVLPGPAPGCMAPGAQCPESLCSPSRGPLCQRESTGQAAPIQPAVWCLGRGPSQRFGGLGERGVSHVKWQGQVRGSHAWGYSRPETNS